MPWKFWTKSKNFSDNTFWDPKFSNLGVSTVCQLSQLRKNNNFAVAASPRLLSTSPIRDATIFRILTKPWNWKLSKPVKQSHCNTALSSSRYIDDGRATNFVIKSEKKVPTKIDFFCQKIPLRFMFILFWDMLKVYLTLVLVLSLSSPTSPGRMRLIWGGIFVLSSEQFY